MALAHSEPIHCLALFSPDMAWIFYPFACRAENDGCLSFCVWQPPGVLDGHPISTRHL